MSSSRPKVLAIGPLPPPPNGMTIATENLLSSSLVDRFTIIHVDISDHRAIATTNRVDSKNVLLALRQAALVTWKMFSQRPNLVYLPIGQDRLGFLRDSLFLLAARLLQRPTVVHLHGARFRDFVRKESWWMRVLVRGCMAPDTHAIVLGAGLRNEFVDYVAAERIHVVPNGVPDVREGSFKATRQDNERPVVLYLSTLWGAKGVFEILEAARRLLVRGCRADFVLAGDWFRDAERDRARQFIQRYQLESHVRFRRADSPELKCELLNGASVFVLPSHNEGQPLVILEALAAGLPVISTPIGAIPDVVRDGLEGFLVEPGAVDALTARLEMLIGDRDRRNRMSEAARLRYESEFTLETFANHLGDVWERALQPSPVESVETRMTTQDRI